MLLWDTHVFLPVGLFLFFHGQHSKHTLTALAILASLLSLSIPCFLPGTRASLSLSLSRLPPHPPARTCGPLQSFQVSVRGFTPSGSAVHWAEEIEPPQNTAIKPVVFKHTAIPPATSFVFCADAWASLPLSPCLNLPSPPILTQQRIFTIERKLAKLVAFCGWRRDSSRSTRAPGRDVQGPDGFVAMTQAAEA